MINKYSKYVPLELPEDKGTPLIIDALNKREALNRNNQAQLQAYTDKIGSIDIARESDKKYFQEKYQGAINQMNSLGSYDFTDTANLRNVTDIMNTVLKDDKIRTDINSTQNLRKLQTQVSKAIADPKLLNSPYGYDGISQMKDKYAMQDYLEGKTNSFNQQNITVNDGTYKLLGDDLKNIKDIKKQYVDGNNFDLLEVTGKSDLAVHSAVYERLGASQSMRNEYDVSKRQNPNFDNILLKGLDSGIQSKKGVVDQIEAQMKGMSPTTVAYQVKQDQLSLAKGQLQELQQIKQNPNSENSGYQLYLKYKADMEIDKHSEKSYVYKPNQAKIAQANFNLGGQKFQYQMNHDAEQFKYKQSRDKTQDIFTAAGLDLKREALEIRATTAAGKGTGTKGGKVVEPGMVGSAGYEEITTDNTTSFIHEQLAKQSSNVSQAIKDINNMGISNEERALIDQTLKTKKLPSLDELSKGKNFSSTALEGVHQALVVLSHSPIANDPRISQIASKLDIIAKNSASQFLYSEVLRNASRATAKSLGIDPSKMTDSQKETFIARQNEFLASSGVRFTEENKMQVLPDDGTATGKNIENFVQAKLRANPTFVDEKGTVIKATGLSKVVPRFLNEDGTITLSTYTGTGKDQVEGKPIKLKLSASEFDQMKQRTGAAELGTGVNLDQLIDSLPKDVGLMPGFSNTKFFIGVNDSPQTMRGVTVPYHILRAGNGYRTIELTYNPKGDTHDIFGNGKKLARGRYEIGTASTINGDSGFISQFVNAYNIAYTALQDTKISEQDRKEIAITKATERLIKANEDNLGTHYKPL